MIKCVHITFLLYVIIVKFLIVIIITLVNQSRITAVLAHCFIHLNRDTLKGHHQFYIHILIQMYQGTYLSRLEIQSLRPTESGQNKRDRCLLVPMKNYEDFFYKGNLTFIFSN